MSGKTDKAEATCAKCGEVKELCNSVKSHGVQQPRICKDCLLDRMDTGDKTIHDLFWLMQMRELGDHESLVALGLETNSQEKQP